VTVRTDGDRKSVSRRSGTEWPQSRTHQRRGPSCQQWQRAFANVRNDLCQGANRELPFASSFCHFGLQSLGTTLQVRAWYIDQIRRPNLLLKWNLRCRGSARRPRQRPRENIAQSGSNGNFSGMVQSPVTLCTSARRPIRPFIVWGVPLGGRPFEPTL
jgi:hypothetical protein